MSIADIFVKNYFEIVECKIENKTERDVVWICEELQSGENL